MDRMLVNEQEQAVREKVKKQFEELPYPLLNVALREMDQILMDRVAATPEKCYDEQIAHDHRQEKLLRSHTRRKANRSQRPAQSR